MMELIRAHRSSDAPFDVVRGAGLPRKDKEEWRAEVEQWVDAGVTWWINGVSGHPGALDTIREVIRKRPPGR